MILQASKTLHVAPLGRAIPRRLVGAPTGLVYRIGKTSPRAFAASGRQDKPDVGGSPGLGVGKVDWAVGQINASIERFPRETLAGMLVMEIVSIYGMHAALVGCGIQVPAEFAVAFAMGRPFRRMRLPLEVLGAAGLCRLVPPLRKVKISTAVSGAMPEVVKDKWKENPTLKEGGDRLGAVVDKYGAAYFISARWIGVGVVLGFYTGIEMGMDVSGFLATYGIGELGTVLGTWAAAVSMSAAMYPFTILGGSFLARPMGLLVRRVTLGRKV